MCLLINDNSFLGVNIDYICLLVDLLMMLILVCYKIKVLK